MMDDVDDEVYESGSDVDFDELNDKSAQTPAEPLVVEKNETRPEFARFEDEALRSKSLDIQATRWLRSRRPNQRKACRRR